jgi:hypothetical protein
MVRGRQRAYTLEQGRVRPVLPHHELHSAQRSHVPYGGGKLWLISCHSGKNLFAYCADALVNKPDLA